MRKKKEELILVREEHELIMNHIRHGINHLTFTRQEADALETELRKATLVEKEELPEDVVCLNTTVTVKEEAAAKLMELTLVTPEKANIKERKISILSPIAAALIGFRKGMLVAWKVPAGVKQFRIVNVRRG